MGSFAAAAPPFAPDDDVVNKYTTAIANDDARATRLLHGIETKLQIAEKSHESGRGSGGSFGDCSGGEITHSAQFRFGFNRLLSSGRQEACFPREGMRFHWRD